MAANPFALTLSNISISAGAAKTIAQIRTATNVRARFNKIVVTISGGTNSELALVEVCRNTVDGTFTNTPTLTKLDEAAGETLQTTAKYPATAEPTTVTPLDLMYAPVAGGQAVFVYTTKDMVSKGGSAMGVRVTAASGATGTLTAAIRIEGEE